MAVYCWIALAVGTAVVITNEASINIKFYRSMDTLRQVNSSDSWKLDSFGFFQATVTPLAAGIWVFVDLSVIHLSFIVSCYQRQLRYKIDHWTELGLDVKEKIRYTYKKVQSIIKVFKFLILNQ